jgi:hypothetical protein
MLCYIYIYLYSFPYVSFGLVSSRFLSFFFFPAAPNQMQDRRQSQRVDTAAVGHAASGPGPTAATCLPAISTPHEPSPPNLLAVMREIGLAICDRYLEPKAGTARAEEPRQESGS